VQPLLVGTQQPQERDEASKAVVAAGVRRRIELRLVVAFL
jgi:hypothetical protein